MEKLSRSAPEVPPRRRSYRVSLDKEVILYQSVMCTVVPRGTCCKSPACTRVLRQLLST